MSDTVGRQAVKELAHNQMREKYCGIALKKQRDFYIKLADSIIDLLPSAQPEPKRGKWISEPHKRARICSCCGHDEPYKFADDNAQVFKFCPFCGADMREVTE